MSAVQPNSLFRIDALSCSRNNGDSRDIQSLWNKYVSET